MQILSGLLIALSASSTGAAAPATGEGWHLDAGPQLIYDVAGAPAYKLDCSGSELVVTQYGVTQLMDLQKNESVSDTEGSALPEGAALMALASDKSDPNLVPASAVRNAARGWDMTIRLPKNDRDFLTLPRAKFVTLFTTGYTRAITLDKDTRKLLATFVSQCGGR
jgi:hypothetical protein